LGCGWWCGSQALIGLLPGPVDQCLEVQLKGRHTPLQRQLLELAAGTVQLLGQLPAKVRLLAQVALGQQPLLNGGLLGQVRLGCAPLHLLQGAQGVGQQAQVMALQSWQQRCFELL